MKKTFLYIITFFFLGINISKAQTPCFTLDKTRGCAPLTTNATDCSSSSSVVYWYGEGIQNYIGTTTYTYDTAGTYKIIQLISIPTGSDTISKMVEVLPSPAPVFTVSLCEDTSANVLINEEKYEEYFIDFGDGFLDTVLPHSTTNHQYLALGNQTITVTGNYVPGNCGGNASKDITLISKLEKPIIFNLIHDSSFSISINFSTQENVLYQVTVSKNDTTNFVVLDTFLAVSTSKNIRIPIGTGNQFCYKISAIDLCGNFNNSKIICLVIPKIEAKDNFNLISWEKYAGLHFSKFTLFKDSIAFGTYNSNEPYAISDSSTFCGIKSFYHLTSVLSDGLEISSKDSFVVGISDKVQDTLYLLSTYNTNNKIELSWKKPKAPTSKFNVFKDGSFLESTNDSILITQGNSCFSVDFNDLCGNTSKNSNIACPINLTAELDIIDRNIAHLSWSNYSNWKTDVKEYQLEILDENNVVLLSKPMELNTSFTDEINFSFSLQYYNYRIKAIENDTNFSYSNRATVEVSNRLFVPNTFSPNDDGLNDVFRVHTRFIESINVYIYDRWNNLVFETTDITTGWDGFYPSGKKAPEGVYSYLVEVKDQTDKSEIKKGTLTLIR